ncbi:MAG TPA: hypothetical protein VIH18_00940 [Candidatus Binatia bacterium]|jgi:hypothetical protein
MREKACRWPNEQKFLGYQRIWVGDSHMIWRKVYALLAAIADMTARRHRVTRRKF